MIKSSSQNFSMRSLQQIAPRISLVVWCLWLLYAMTWVFISGHHFRFDSYEDLANNLRYWFVSFGTKGGGILLSAMLCRRRNPGLAFTLAALCVYVLWMLYLGPVLMPAVPGYGSYTLEDSFKLWWHSRTDSVFLFLSIPFGVFGVASVLFWPIYALNLPSEKPARVS
jgi:hypothetical protein